MQKGISAAIGIFLFGLVLGLAFGLSIGWTHRVEYEQRIESRLDKFITVDSVRNIYKIGQNPKFRESTIYCDTLVALGIIIERKP